jgi:hypothetical protein
MASTRAQTDERVRPALVSADRDPLVNVSMTE